MTCDWFYDSCHPWIPSKEIQICKVILEFFFISFSWYFPIHMMIGHSFDFYERSLCTTTTRSLPVPHRLACHAKKRVWSLSFPKHARPKRVFTTRPTRIYRFGCFSLKPRVKKKYLGWHSPKIFYRSLLTWHPADGADTCKSDAMWSLYWPQPNNLSLSRSLFFSLGGFLCEFLNDFRLFFCAFRVGLRGMTENLRPNIPSPFPEPQAMAGCVSELTRTNSDSSAITADTSKEPSHHCGNARTVNFELFNFF